MCRAVAPQAGGVGGVTGPHGAAPSRTASPRAAAGATTKIWQLSLELSFQRRAWPALPIGGRVAQDSALPSVDSGVPLRVDIGTFQSCQNIPVQL